MHTPGKYPAHAPQSLYLLVSASGVIPLLPTESFLPLSPKARMRNNICWTSSPPCRPVQPAKQCCQSQRATRRGELGEPPNVVCSVLFSFAGNVSPTLCQLLLKIRKHCTWFSFFALVATVPTFPPSTKPPKHGTRSCSVCAVDLIKPPQQCNAVKMA